MISEDTPNPEPVEAPKACGNCKFHFPETQPIVIPIPSANKITRPGEMRALAVMMCQNPESPYFMCLRGVAGECPQHEAMPVPERVQVPLKIANRMDR